MKTIMKMKSGGRVVRNLNTHTHKHRQSEPPINCRLFICHYSNSTHMVTQCNHDVLFPLCSLPPSVVRLLHTLQFRIGHLSTAISKPVLHSPGVTGESGRSGVDGDQKRIWNCLIRVIKPTERPVLGPDASHMMSSSFICLWSFLFCPFVQHKYLSNCAQIGPVLNTSSRLIVEGYNLCGVTSCTQLWGSFLTRRLSSCLRTSRLNPNTLLFLNQITQNCFLLAENHILKYSFGNQTPNWVSNCPTIILGGVPLHPLQMTKMAVNDLDLQNYFGQKLTFRFLLFQSKNFGC